MFVYFFDGREGIAALDILIHNLQTIRSKILVAKEVENAR